MLRLRQLRDFALFLLPDGLRHEFGANITQGVAHPTDETRMQSGLLAGVPMWITGIFIGLLVATGTFPVLRAFPASYAGIPDEHTASRQGDVPSAPGNAVASARLVHVAVQEAANQHRGGTRCQECAVVESMRQIGRSGDAATGESYEFTVRFRDGSTTVFNEASPRNWRVGSRLMVIGRLKTSTD